MIGVDAVIPRIGASVTFYGSAVVRQFEMMKIFTAVESQAFVRLRDKLRSLQLLSRAGLGMPKTAFASASKDIDTVLSQVGGAPGSDKAVRRNSRYRSQFGRNAKVGKVSDKIIFSIRC